MITTRLGNDEHLRDMYSQYGIKERLVGNPWDIQKEYSANADVNAVARALEQVVGRPVPTVNNARRKLLLLCKTI